ncbi:MAG: hypothetical protein GWP91_23000, partial [Rhodobacterales bacterium]|nr:hypothetical protein [Rhodobacterales bacterium]
VVEPHGNIHSETIPFTRVNRVVEVRMAKIPTFYASFGDWFGWLCALVGGGALVLAPWRRSAKTS